MVVIAPSILSADFARLGEQVVESEQGGAGRVHIDVMDGHFVPNLSMGPAIVGSLRRVTRLPLEVHLMVEQPERFVDAFLAKGADTLIAHLEVLPDPRPFVRRLHDVGKKAALAVRPDTPGRDPGAIPRRDRPGPVHDGPSRIQRPGVPAGEPGPHPAAA